MAKKEQTYFNTWRFFGQSLTKIFKKSSFFCIETLNTMCYDEFVIWYSYFVKGEFD